MLASIEYPTSPDAPTRDTQQARPPPQSAWQCWLPALQTAESAGRPAPPPTLDLPAKHTTLGAGDHGQTALLRWAHKKTAWVRPRSPTAVAAPPEDTPRQRLAGPHLPP